MVKKKGTAKRAAKTAARLVDTSFLEVFVRDGIEADSLGFIGKVNFI